MSIEEKLRETIDDIIMLKAKLTALRIDYYSLQQSVSEDKTWHDKYLDAIKERDQARINDAKCEAARVYISELLEVERAKAKSLEERLRLLSRYHGGDGSVTRDQVFNALSGKEWRE